MILETVGCLRHKAPTLFRELLPAQMLMEFVISSDVVEYQSHGHGQCRDTRNNGVI